MPARTSSPIPAALEHLGSQTVGVYLITSLGVFDATCAELATWSEATGASTTTGPYRPSASPDETGQISLMQ